jgi:hypothetical protein
MRRFSTWLLEWAERLFLHSHGWMKREDGYYDPPDDYPTVVEKDKATGTVVSSKRYVRSHAVNSQKQFIYNQRLPGTFKKIDPDLRKEKGYETL